MVFGSLDRAPELTPIFACEALGGPVAGRVPAECGCRGASLRGVFRHVGVKRRTEDHNGGYARAPPDTHFGSPRTQSGCGPARHKEKAFPSLITECEYGEDTTDS
jgi:hypothetical protein